MVNSIRHSASSSVHIIMVTGHSDFVQEARDSGRNSPRKSAVFSLLRSFNQLCVSPPTGIC